MQRVLSEDFGERLAERPLAAAALADEDQRDLGCLARMLHRPGEPVHNVLVDTPVTGGERFADVLAQQTPVPLLWLDAPSSPEVEPPIDDECARGTEDDAGVLPASDVFEPPTADIDTALADLNAPIEIKISKVAEAQERWHKMHVALATGDVFHSLEAQDQRLPAVEHHTIVDVKLGESLRVLGFALGGLRFLRCFRRADVFLGYFLEPLLGLFGRLLNERVHLLARAASRHPIAQILLLEHDDAYACGNAA